VVYIEQVCAREREKRGARTVDGDNEEVLGTRVVSTVHDGSHRQTEGNAELVALVGGSSTLRHGVRVGRGGEEEKREEKGRGRLEGKGQKRRAEHAAVNLGMLPFLKRVTLLPMLPNIVVTLL
jgi:hypothetical protein